MDPFHPEYTGQRQQPMSEVCTSAAASPRDLVRQIVNASQRVEHTQTFSRQGDPLRTEALSGTGITLLENGEGSQKRGPLKLSREVDPQCEAQRCPQFQSTSEDYTSLQEKSSSDSHHRESWLTSTDTFRGSQGLPTPPHSRNTSGSNSEDQLCRGSNQVFHPRLSSTGQSGTQPWPSLRQYDEDVTRRGAFQAHAAKAQLELRYQGQQHRHLPVTNLPGAYEFTRAPWWDRQDLPSQYGAQAYDMSSLTAALPATAPRPVSLAPMHGTSFLNAFQARQGFRPMHAVLHQQQQQQQQQQHVLQQPSHILENHSRAVDVDILSQKMAGMGALCSRFSPSYHGMHSPANASADTLPDDMNCAVWLTNLPADVTYTELLGLLLNTGRVWCTFINEPDRVRHQTAAAKVVYFDAASAVRLLSKARSFPAPSQGASGLMLSSVDQQMSSAGICGSDPRQWMQGPKGLSLRGHSVKATRNRIKTPPHSTAGNASRVLIISGTSVFATPENLVVYFSRLFIFQLDQVQTLLRGDNTAVVEIRFGSYRCQAQMGKMALEKDRPTGFFKVEFGQDPCEVEQGGFDSYMASMGMGLSQQSAI